MTITELGLILTDLAEVCKKHNITLDSNSEMGSTIYRDGKIVVYDLRVDKYGKANCLMGSRPINVSIGDRGAE